MDKFKVKTINRETIKVEGELVKSSKPVKPPKWFEAFAKEQKEFNKEQKEFNKKQELFNKEQKDFNKQVIQRFDKQDEFNKEQKEFNHQVIKRLDNIEGDVNNLKEDMSVIKSLPTIQKEFKENKNQSN